MLNKAQMEEIWNKKPVGYLKSFNKTNKSHKWYKVIMKPFKLDYYEEREVKVWSTEHQAQREAQAVIRNLPEFKGMELNGVKHAGYKIDGFSLVRMERL
jgi:hypothetical protein